MNTNTQLTLAALALVTASACGAPQLDAKNFKEGQQQIVVLNAGTPYKPCPAAIPIECEIAVLEGNPKSDGLFTLRLRTTKPWVVNPHSHPKSERVTVLGGTVNVGFGDAINKDGGTAFVAGDYYVNRAGENHFVWTDQPVEIQITGIGPWEMHFHK